MRNLGLLNVLWDGGSHSVGRRTSESFTVKGARLTVALQIQEMTLRKASSNNPGGLARGTGFLARFLIAWPESTQGYRPFTEAPEHWPHLGAFHRRIAAILANPVPIDEDGTLKPAVMMLTPDAKAAPRLNIDAIGEVSFPAVASFTTCGTLPANPPTTRRTGSAVPDFPSMAWAALSGWTVSSRQAGLRHGADESRRFFAGLRYRRNSRMQRSWING